MTLFAMVLIVCSVWICQAYPHDMGKLPHDRHDHHHHDYHDIIDLAAHIAASFKLNDIDEDSANVKPSELMNCIPQEHRKNIHELCDKKIHDQKDHTPPMAAECVLTFINALNNVTGVLDLAVLKTQIIEVSTLTPEQKKLASTKLEFCIESNFTLPDHPPFVADAKNITMEEIFHGLEKYDIRNNPMRVMVCVACALIENGCSSVPIVQNSNLVSAPVSIDTDNSSEENAAQDDEDDDDIIAPQA